MTFDEFMRGMLDFLPDAVVDEDNYGQLIIYTNLTENGDGTLREMTEDDFE